MRGRASVGNRHRPAVGVGFAAGLVLASTALVPLAAAATKVLPQNAAASIPRRDFPALPNLPDLNWADLPVKLTIQDIVTYNDNVFAVGNHQPVPGPSRGDFYNLTLLGANSKFYLGRQTVALSGVYGWTRYLTDTNANSSQYNLNGIVDWKFTSRCSGTLTATISKLPSVAEEQIGSGVNNVQLQSYTETAKCLVWGGFSLIANSGVISTRNSSGLNRLVDNDSKYVAGGVGYDWSALDSSQLLYKHTDRLYPNRSVDPFGANLAREIVEDDVSLSYSRFFSPRLDASASAGLTRIQLISAGPGGQSATVAPHYSLSANWRPGEKITLSALVARSVGAPTTILANEQITDSASLSAFYLWSPKTTFNATVSISSATRSFLQGSSGSPFFADTKSTTAALGMSYRMTPFITGNLNYQFSERRGGGLDIVVNRVTAGLNYAPY